MATTTKYMNSNSLSLAVLGWRTISKTVSATPSTVTRLSVAVTITITRATSGGVTTATATVAAAGVHRFLDGQEITITGADQAGYNGRWVVTVTGAGTFTFDLKQRDGLPFSDPGAATGTIIASYTPQAQWALIKADSGNSAAIAFGDINCDFDTIAAGYVYELKCPTGAKFDLSSLYFKSTMASAAYTVLFI